MNPRPTSTASDRDRSEPLSESQRRALETLAVTGRAPRTPETQIYPSAPAALAQHPSRFSAPRDLRASSSPAPDTATQETA